MDEFKILLKAIVDAKDTQAQLDAIKNLSVKIEKLNLDQSAITELRNQLSKNGIDVNLVLGNTSQIQNQAKQTGQQIGKLVSDSAERAITGVSSKRIGRYFRIDPSTSREFENEMRQLVSQWTNAKGEMTDLKIDTRTVYDKDADASFERLHQATVTYKNDLDEVTKKTIAWRQIGTTTDTKGNEVAIRGFVEVAGQYSKALEKASIAADTFADKQIKLKATLSNSLNSIKSSVADQSASKPIKDQANISSLQSQYQIVEQAIANVGSASKSNFAQMEVDARTQISALNDMVRQYRNAENVATSLRTKDFSTVKDIQVQNLQAFKNKIEGSNVPIAKMQTELNELDTAINNAFDVESLISYLNQMDVVQAKFKQLSAEITSSNRNEKVGISVSGLESKITDIQRISPEINNFKTQINGAEVSVESLLSDLSRVNSQGDFSVVNAKFKTFADLANTAGIAVDTFADKRIKLKAALSNSFNSIKSSVADQTTSKPIKDQNNISSLQAIYKSVEQAIENVGNASKSNFAQMEADARTQISVLNDLVRQYRNEEYWANSIKDFPIQKDIQIQNLQAFKNKIEGSNVPIAKMEEDLSNLDAALNNVFDTESLTSYLNQMDDVQSKFKKLSAEITSSNRNEKVGISVSGLESKITDIQRISPEINNFKIQIEGAEVSVESLLRDLSDVNSQGDFSVVNAKFKTFADSAKAAGIAVTGLAAYAKKIDDIQRSINNGHGVSSYQNQINGLINDFQRYGVSAKEAETITSNLQTTFNAMKNMSGQELVNQADKFEQEFKSVKVSIDHAKLAYDKLMQPASKEKVTTTLIKVQNLLSDNTRVTKKVRQEWELYVARLSSGSDIAEKELNDIKIRLKETESQMRNMGRLGLSFGDSVKRGMGSFTQWVSATSILMGSVNTVRKMISEVKELDNAQVELVKVSDLSEKGLADVTKEAYELGETVAKTGTQVLDAVTEFKRSGYDMTESMNFAEQALTMVNVAEGIDQASDAATALISIMKGYGDSSSDFAQKILDATNQVSNTQSINFD